nr:MAG TPA: hypothetical protein [Caudoviricetes sp.]
MSNHSPQFAENGYLCMTYQKVTAIGRAFCRLYIT